MTNISKHQHYEVTADNAEDACVYGDKGKVTDRYEGGSFLAGLGSANVWTQWILAFVGKVDIAKLLSQRDLHQYAIQEQSA